MDGEPVSGPIPVGIVGLGRMGLHHLERLALGDEFRVVALCDSDPDRLRLANANGVTQYQRTADLLADPGVKVVFIATGVESHAELAHAALVAGRHTAVEMPLACSSGDAEALLATAEHSGRLLTVVENHRWDGDFRSAREAVRSGSLGQLLALKYVGWSRGLPANGLAIPRKPLGSADALLDQAPALVDQLLELVDDVPQQVFATLSTTDTGATSGMSAVLTFASGLRAEIDIDLRSFAPLQTGWLLAGSAAAWKKSRRYYEAPDGEIVDLAVETLPTDWNGWYGDFARRLQSGEDWWTSARRARDVVAIIEGVRRSAEHGAPVRIDCAGIRPS